LCAEGGVAGQYVGQELQVIKKDSLRRQSLADSSEANASTHNYKNTMETKPKKQATTSSD